MLNLGKKAYESAIASRRTWNEVFGTKQGKAVLPQSLIVWGSSRSSLRK